MLRPVLAIVVVAATADANAAEQFFDADNYGQIAFSLPSGNIGCVYTPEGGTAIHVPADGGPELLCDRIAPTYLRFGLNRNGPAWLTGDVADASCCGGPVFEYGNFWRAGPFYCEATTSGLDCRRDNHGFFISRATASAH